MSISSGISLLSEAYTLERNCQNCAKIDFASRQKLLWKIPRSASRDTTSSRKIINCATERQMRWRIVTSLSFLFHPSALCMPPPKGETALQSGWQAMHHRRSSRDDELVLSWQVRKLPRESREDLFNSGAARLKSSSSPAHYQSQRQRERGSREREREPCVIYNQLRKYLPARSILSACLYLTLAQRRVHAARRREIKGKIS